MNGADKITKSEIINQIWNEYNDKYNKRDIEFIINSFIRIIGNGINNNLKVKIEGLGTFSPYYRNVHFNKSFNKNSKSKIKGVYWSERLGKWYAKIHYNRKSIHLGVFENQNDAIKARKNAEQKYFGEYAYKDYKNMEEFI